MTVGRIVLAAICSTVGFGAATASQVDLPNPDVYARAEDQERAHLLTKPCAEADVGRGCYRLNNRTVREAPCTYHIGEGAIGSLPTDQCYKMEKPRLYRGIWVDEFEGQAFIPAGTTAPQWPTISPGSPGWREQFDRVRAARIWLDIGRVKLEPGMRNSGRKMLIEFVGRKTRYSGQYGHLGMSGHEIIVDSVVSLKECPPMGVCG